MDYIILSTSALSDAGLLIAPTGYNDAFSYMKVYNPNTFEIRPEEKISVLIVPHDLGITASEASGLLADPDQISITSSGLYIWRYTNVDSPITQSNLHVFPIERAYENVKYDLHWLQQQVESTIFNSNIAGVYSYPHNLQPQEARLKAELIDNNTRMRYTLIFKEVNNSGSEDYRPSNMPYLLNISYTTSGTVTGYFGSSEYVFSDDLIYSGFAAGEPTSGIVFDLPFYDPRVVENRVPAQYVLRVGYNCADPLVTGSLPLSIPLNHQSLSTSELIDLDTWVSTHANFDHLSKVDEIYIEPAIDEAIDRTRLSIGIKDISIKQNAYKKKGTYVSNPYSSEFPIYTFSLRVDEFIPQYSNLSQYDAVQYFVEFNSRPWIRISPMNRNLELDSEGESVPKMFIFDKDPGQGSTDISFLDYQAPVNIFRIKIVFDLSTLNDNLFIPPEIKDYECIIFDKNQLLEL